MALPRQLLTQLESGSAVEAWGAAFGWAWDVCSQPFASKNPVKEIVHRDHELEPLDHYLSVSAYDLWNEFDASVEKNADALANWWAQPGGRAILILDGLSLRETPWLLEGAKSRGYEIGVAGPKAAVLPADTNTFAKALGFPQRSALQNNRAGSGHRFPGAKTDCVGIALAECADLIGSEPRWLFWHEWPDKRMHDLSAPGQGLEALEMEVKSSLESDGFWKLIERLTQGRSLVITSDHGYAASGFFGDVTDDAQKEYLARRFKSGRFAPDDGQPSSWTPPLDLKIESPNYGPCRFVLGRRKWKTAGGYPTLTHGGLSVLEVALPFIELNRVGGK